MIGVEPAAPAVAREPVEAPPSPAPSATSVVALGIGLVGVLVLALVVGGARPTAVPAGLPQAGPLVDWGLPVVRLAGRIAALGTVGTLLFAAVLRPGPGSVLPAVSRRAVRAASAWALAWVGTTVLGAVLTVSELLGVQPAALPATALATFVTDLAAGRAALVVLGAAALVAVLARWCTRPVAVAALLVAALVGLVVPAVLTGHSSAADDHVLAVTNLAVHVVAASLWVGGLLALLAHGRSADDRVPASARFSALALGCFLATGASGFLAAWIVLGGDTQGLAAAVGTGYGWLLAGKAGALVALGVFGWHHRRRTLPRLRAGEHRSFARFAAVEAAVLLATVALAVALSAAPPPAGASGAVPVAAQPGQPTVPEPKPAADPMAGHDHGELSVTVLIDETRFHVKGTVEPGALVTVHNSTDTEVTISADDGSFDLVVAGLTLTTFVAPGEAGEYPFTSRHSEFFADVLVVE